MYLVEKHYVNPQSKFYKECHQLCFIAKNLYNQTLYQLYTNNHLKDIEDKKLYQIGKTYHVIKNFPEFRTINHSSYNGRYMPVRPLKSVLLLLEWVFKSYFAAKKEYDKFPYKFTGHPKKPKYLKKNARTVLTYGKEALSFKSGKIRLSQTDIYIESKFANKENIAEVSIVPVTHGYDIIIKYKKTEENTRKQNNRFMGVDFGVNNFAACISNDPNMKPFVVNGKTIKSINQYYNKKMAKMKSNLPKGIYSSKEIRKLSQKRNHKIHNEMHKMTTFIVDQCMKNNISVLVVGVNKGWKQKVSIGKKNNQNFVSIPYYKARNMMKYKCQLLGITYIEVDESYTSKCSAMDLEPIMRHNSYIGNRKYRGLFEHGNGKINADINGSLNIIRKVAGNSVFIIDNSGKLVEGYAVSPHKVTITFDSDVF
jgi:putative transposase